MISVVIPAHNESSVIGRTLLAITAGALPNELDVIVICNGCGDHTASIAQQFGPPVRVIETRKASKTHALNLGDEAALTFPRVYVDADVLVSISTIRALAQALEADGVLAAAPKPTFELGGCPWAVRAFYDIRSRLPSFLEGIGGSGVYALSEAGRRRFGPFPDIVADDTYVRVHFRPDERKTLSHANSVVFPPQSLKNLISIESRADYGTFELARLFPELWANKGASNHKSVFALAKKLPLWSRLFVYFYVRITAHHRAKLSSARHFVWKRDESSRHAEPSGLPDSVPNLNAGPDETSLT